MTLPSFLIRITISRIDSTIWQQKTSATNYMCINEYTWPLYNWYVFTICFRYISQCHSYSFDNDVIHWNFNIVLLCNWGSKMNDHREYIYAQETELKDLKLIPYL